jgi:hypothetical protein
VEGASVNKRVFQVRIPNVSDRSTHRRQTSRDGSMFCREYSNSPKCSFVTVNTRFYSQGLARITEGPRTEGSDDHERLPLSREALVLSTRPKAQSTPLTVSQRTCASVSVLSPLTLCLYNSARHGHYHTHRAPHGRSHQRTLIDLLVIPRTRFIANMMFPFEECMSFPPINDDYLCSASPEVEAEREKNAVRDRPSRTPPCKPPS